jgi:hypothetical protein
VLNELGLAALDQGDGGEMSCKVLNGVRTDLDRSPAHRSYALRLSEIDRYLAEEASRWPTAAEASAL